MLEKVRLFKWELLIFFIVLVIAGISHSYNMFGFPYYENDEGVYMSQAWSVLTQGKLAPYTYWYDHAPAGWLLIALWVKLTGGFFTFGPAVNSGRVLMLVLHLGTCSLLFYVANKLSKSILVGVISVLIFSLSPLGIYFQRRVLLDNIMIFWVFLSLALLYKDRLKLSSIFLSALTFGIAVLTKENAIFFIPAFLYIVYTRSHVLNRSFALVKWLAISGSIVTFYFVYAFLKGEFFPVGFFNNSDHVSLLDTLYMQIERGKNLYFWNKGSDFYLNLMEWLSRDPIFIVGGIASTILSFFLSIIKKELKVPVFLSLLFWLFLIMGKTIINFYVIPLIPLLAVTIASLFVFIAKKISFGKKHIFEILNFAFITGYTVFSLMKSSDQYFKDETGPQVRVVEWIIGNLSDDTAIIVDDYAYVDLHERRLKTDKVFANADLFRKIISDPEIKGIKYGNDWRRIEYIALSHEMLRQIKLDKTQNILNSAFNNSYLIKEWLSNKPSYRDIKNMVSTNGDWMAIYKLKDNYDMILEGSWDYYKSKYLRSYGQVVDPANNEQTTSEGQSYALLRSVWLNDKTSFDGIWSWTRDHLQYRTKDKLFSWLWTKAEGDLDYKLGDSGSAADADEDIALALIFANKKWGDENYLISAKEIVNDIWKKEVVRINGRYYLTAGSGASRNDGYLVNPSYLSPATYRIFAQVDKVHPWEKLADDSYFLINKLGDASPVYLPPNWVLIDNSGNIGTTSKYINDRDAGNYGFDAFRLMWRVALDAKWFGSESAIDYLENVSPFFEREWRENRSFFSTYDIKGIQKSTYGSLSTSTGALSVFDITNKNLSDEVYGEILNNKYNYDGRYWSDKNNYYDQNWAWFATALYSGNLSNLWSE